MSIDLTDEQRDVVYDESDEIYIDAGAGTGKTSTLVEHSKLRRVKILYIVYNTDMGASASMKFPEWVEVVTIHGKAHRAVGRDFSFKLKNNIKAEDILEFGYVNKSSKDSYNLAFSVVQELSAFLNSADMDFPNTGKETTKIAQKVWLSMIDKNSQMPMSHDGYLKMFHLQRPHLEYDYIMVDEAQDSNAVMLDIIKSQTHASLIYVGDPNQKIYGFRGALNIFQTVSSEADIKRLSKSFRFGQEIADVANAVLRYKSKNSDPLTLIGCDIESKIVDTMDDFGKTIITRTNATLLDLAISDAIAGKSYAIQGGTQHIMDNAADVFNLYMGNRQAIKSEYIKTFESFKNFNGFIQEMNIPEYKLTLKLLEKYGKGLMDMLQLVTANQASLKSAEKRYTTAHKSKGLEFVNVELAEDFVQLKKGEEMKCDEEELNLLYVAATRAVFELKLNESLKNICY